MVRVCIQKGTCGPRGPRLRSGLAEPVTPLMGRTSASKRQIRARGRAHRGRGYSQARHTRQSATGRAGADAQYPGSRTARASLSYESRVGVTGQPRLVLDRLCLDAIGVCA